MDTDNSVVTATGKGAKEWEEWVMGAKIRTSAILSAIQILKNMSFSLTTSTNIFMNINCARR